MARYTCMHYLRFASSIVGVILGVLASAAFFIMYHHVEASVWAFTSAIFAAVCMNLHILYHKNRLQVWHSKETLEDITFLGLMVMLVGYACTIWYLFTGFYHHRAIMPVNDSPYITAVWSFMTGKWGMFLFLNSRTYSNMLSSGSLPILLSTE